MPYGRTYAPRTQHPRTPPKPPEHNPYKDLTPGRYALFSTVTKRWHFFKVDNPTEGTWAGFTFLKEYHGEDTERIRGSLFDRIMQKIAANPIGAAKDYGLQTAHCGVCGIQLTDPDSIARGIGPVCAQKY